MKPEIIFEDNYIVVANKPNNMLVHHSSYAKNLENEEALVDFLEILTHQKLYPVHRLDYKTSGLVMLCKHRKDVSIFQSLFENQLIEKKYTALLRGFVEESGIIDSPVKNERGNYKEALTHYKCLQHFELNIPVEPYSTARYSMVEMQPKTGRTNQLRIHANKINHPIIGDPKFGNRHHNHMFAEKLKIPFLFLHAQSLSFTHPFTTEKLEISSDLPNFWHRFLEIKINS
jgi:tRNA pseudouridine65 synthase